jgi:hypothetical protein
MMESKKKALKKEYQQNLTPMGVYQIRNLANEKIFIGSSLNLPGIINRQKFALGMGGHQNKALQADWQEFGGDNFAFEILDELTPVSDPQHDYKDDLAFLEEMWLEKLQPYDERGYNERKKSREDRLRMIAENQRAASETE